MINEKSKAEKCMLEANSQSRRLRCS